LGVHLLPGDTPAGLTTMTEKFRQAKKEAKKNDVEPDGHCEFTTHVLDDSGELGYLTVDVWADRESLSDISPGLYNALSESHKPEHADYLARNIPAMLRDGLIWDCLCSRNDINDTNDLEDAIDSGQIELMRY
jgi:hypothetical protein